MEKTINFGSACDLLDALWNRIIQEAVQDHLHPHGAYAEYTVMSVYSMSKDEILSFFEDIVFRGARLMYYASDLNKTIRPMLKY